MNTPIPVIGDVIEVQFVDHVEDSHRLMHTTVWGRVIKISSKRLVVRSWEAEGKHNCKDWAIVRSTIESVSVLGEVR